MSNVVNFKEKYVQTLLEEIEDAEDATDVISIQRKYRVSVELQNLFREFIGSNKSHIDFQEALPELDETTKHFLIVSYYLLWNYIYKINDKDDLYKTLEDNGIGPDDEWFVLEPEQNRKIYYYLFSNISEVCASNEQELSLFETTDYQHKALVSVSNLKERNDN